MSLWADERALATEFAKLIMSLGVGAALIWVIYTATNPLLAEADAMAPGGLGGAQMNDWFEIAGDVIPAVFLGVAFFGFIATAVVQRRRV